MLGVILRLRLRGRGGVVAIQWWCDASMLLCQKLLAVMRWYPLTIRMGGLWLLVVSGPVDAVCAVVTSRH